jgi:uncharacterized protein
VSHPYEPVQAAAFIALSQRRGNVRDAQNANGLIEPPIRDRGSAMPHRCVMMRDTNLRSLMRHAIVAIVAVVAIFAALLAVAPVSAQSPQPPAPAPAPAPAAPSADTLAAARQLVQVMKATDQFKVLLPSIFAALKPAIVQDRPDAAKDYDAIVPIVTAGAMKRLDAFGDMLAGIYARNFSTDEIHDLIAFYQTPTGRKLIERQPTIAQQSMAAGQQFGRELVADLKQQIDEELKKRGDAK